MKRSLPVGILTSQTLLPAVVSEAKALSNKKLDSNHSRSSEEPPIFRGGSNLVHVGSTITTPFKQQQQQQSKSKKTVECIPPRQGECITEADYDLGVLACATSSTTIVGQVCVPSDDSTLGGYCMDPPPPLTDATEESRHLLKRVSAEGLLRQYCEDKDLSIVEPFERCDCQYSPNFVNCVVYDGPYRTCGLISDVQVYSFYAPDLSLYRAAKVLEFVEDGPSGYTLILDYTIFPKGQCYEPSSGGLNCKRCFNTEGIEQNCPTVLVDDVDCISNVESIGDCRFTCFDSSDDSNWTYLFGCITERSPARCEATYRNPHRGAYSCVCENGAGSVKIDCKGSDLEFSIDTSNADPFEDLPFAQACNIPKPKKTPKPKAPKTPKPQRPSRLQSPKSSDS